MLRSGAKPDLFALALSIMCLMLYVGCKEPLGERSDPDLRVEPVEPGRRAIEQWFSLPSVQFVGAHTGCSCGFPHVVAETPREYWDATQSGDTAVFTEQFLYEVHA